MENGSSKVVLSCRKASSFERNLAINGWDGRAE